MDVSYTWSMAPYVSRGEPRSFGLVYNSRQAFVAPVVSVDAFPGSTAGTPDRISMRLWVNGSWVKHLDTDSTQVYFSASGLATNRLAFQFDANNLSTGVYDDTIEVRFWRSGTYTSQRIASKLMIVRRDSTRYGAGWAPAGVQQLAVVDTLGSVLIYDGDGSAVYFRRTCTSCTFIPPLGEHSRLTESSGIHTRRYRDGTRIRFDSNGQMVRVFNIYGDSTVLEWSLDTLKVIRDPAEWPIKLVYEAGRLHFVADSTAVGGLGRIYGFTYNSTGDLTAIDNGLYARDASFSYSTTPGYQHLMTGFTDAVGKTSSFTYQHPRRGGGRQSPPVMIADSSGSQTPTLRLHSADSLQVANFSAGQGTSGSPRPFLSPTNAVQAFTKPAGHKYTVSVDRFGAVERYEENAFRYVVLGRDSMSQVDTVRTIRGDTITMKYDSMGNVLRVRSAKTGRVDSTTFHLDTIDGFVVTVGPFDVRSNNTRDPQPSYRYTMHCSPNRGSRLTVQA